MDEDTSKACILGFDGVPWSLIESWATDGALPNFNRLIQEGACGPLKSTVPDATPLAWPSLSTGVRPDKHGIYGFQRLTETYTHQMNTGDHLAATPLWDHLSPAVVANVPMTYPAAEVDGVMVASIMSPAIDEKYTHPPSLADEIGDIPGYEIALRWADYLGNEDALIEDINELVEARRMLMNRLLEEEWQLFYFAFIEPDRLQHLVWDKSVLREHYTMLDDILGDVLSYIEDEDVNLFVVSDHGFGSVSTSVGVNRLLEQEGYLVRANDGGAQSLLNRLGITKTAVDAVSNRLGVDHHSFLKQYAPRRVIDLLATTVPGNHSLYDLDHGKTQAFVHEFGSLYVNDADRFADGPVAPSDVGRVKQRLTDLFESLTHHETGETVIDVCDGDDLFPTDSRSPDLVLQPAPEYTLSNALETDVFDDPKENAGHRPEGMFLAWGPDFKSGGTPADATVLDVAPTLLHSLGETLPDTIDGRVLWETFSSDSPAANREVKTNNYDNRVTDADSDENMEPVKDRLRGLGYLS